MNSIECNYSKSYHYFEIIPLEISKKIYDYLNSDSKSQFCSTNHFWHSYHKKELMLATYNKLRIEIRDLNQNKKNIINEMVKINDQIEVVVRTRKDLMSNNDLTYFSSREERNMFHNSFDSELKYLEEEQKNYQSKLSLLIKTIKRKKVNGLAISKLYKKLSIT
jgi:hypothetical protein